MRGDLEKPKNNIKYVKRGVKNNTINCNVSFRNHFTWSRGKHKK